MSSFLFKCSLCDMVLPDEDSRLVRHEEWHGKARIQGRNTTQGVVEWEDVSISKCEHCSNILTLEEHNLKHEGEDCLKCIKRLENGDLTFDEEEYEYDLTLHDGESDSEW